MNAETALINEVWDDVSPEAAEMWLRGRTNTELREILLYFWRIEIVDYEHDELVEFALDSWVNGIKPISDLGRDELVEEIMERHPGRVAGPPLDKDDPPMV